MTAQQIITEHLDIWTAAHKTRSSAGRGNSNKLDLYGIKKLRELILELAVRGKLIPQDPNDEPASELLKKIASKKKQLIKEGKIKKEKPLPEVTDVEKHFELPLGWEFIRLGELTSKLGSGSTPRGGQAAYQETGIIFLRSQNVWNDGLKLDDTAYISNDTHHAMEGTHVYPNDILLNITGASLGRTTIFPAELKIANVSQHVTIIRLIESQMVKFVHLGIMSPMVQRLVWGRQVGMAIEGLSKKVLEQFEFPIPPLAEQQRIVAKVDELMVFCDQLEQTQSDNIAAHAQLVEALLTTLTNSADHKELQTNWQRIAAHFDTLFTTEHSINQLKQTILQLAVMGKLVPQNPNDEPASELLKKIAAEKARLIKEGKIRKEKPLPEITDEENPFELPSGWEWVRLSNLLPQFQNGVSSRGDRSGKEVVVLRLADIKNWKVSLADTRTLEISAESISRYALKKNDVLIIRVNGSADIVGRFVGLDSDINAIYCDHFIRMNFPIECLHTPYLCLLGSSGLIRNRIADLFVSTAGQKTVNQTHIGSLQISLPPVEEQHRIVAKVDELMALCDTLKTNLQNAQSTQLALADALVEQAVS